MQALVTYFCFDNGTWFRAIGRSRKETEAIFSRYFSKTEVVQRGGAKRKESWVEVGPAIISDSSSLEVKGWTIGRY